MPRNRKKTGQQKPFAAGITTNSSAANTGLSSIASSATTTPPPAVSVTQPSTVTPTGASSPARNPAKSSMAHETRTPTIGETPTMAKSPKKNSRRQRPVTKKSPAKPTVKPVDELEVDHNSEKTDGGSNEVKVLYDADSSAEKKSDSDDTVAEDRIVDNVITNVNVDVEQVEDKPVEKSNGAAVPEKKSNPFAHLARTNSPMRRVVKAKQPPTPVDPAKSLTPVTVTLKEPIERNGHYSNLKSPSQAREKGEEEKQLSRQLRLNQTTKNQKEHKKAFIEEKRKHSVHKEQPVAGLADKSDPPPPTALKIPAIMSVEPQYPEHKRAATSAQEDEVTKRYKQGEELSDRSVDASFPDEDVEGVSIPCDEDNKGSNLWKLTGLLAAATVIVVGVIIANKRRTK
jgi:hypothetical protein